MFFKCKLGNGNTLLINLGTDMQKAANVVKMFETSAGLLVQEYGGTTSVKPVEATIVLGDVYKETVKAYNQPDKELVFAPDRSFCAGVEENYEVFLNSKALDASIAKMKKDHELALANKDVEIANLKEKVEQLTNRLDED